MHEKSFHNRFNVRLITSTPFIQKVLHSSSSQSNMKSYGKNFYVHTNISPSAWNGVQYLRKECLNLEVILKLKNMSSIFRLFSSSKIDSGGNKMCSSFYNLRLILPCHTVLESYCYKLSNGTGIASFDAWLRTLWPYEGLRNGLPVWPLFGMQLWRIGNPDRVAILSANLKLLPAYVAVFRMKIGR